MFNIKKCSCGKECWYYSLTGKIKHQGEKLQIYDGNHLISFNDYLRSLGISENDMVTISVEKERINE